MEVSCPKCSSRFNLADDLAVPGVKLRCSICKTVFPLPEKRQIEKVPLRVDTFPSDSGRLPEMPSRKKSGMGLWLFVFALLVAGCAYSLYYYNESQKEEAKIEEAAKQANDLKQLAFRDVRQMVVPNEKLGKIFVIEGKAVNGFSQPLRQIEIEGTLLDKDKQQLAAKRQLAGTQLSLMQLQVLSEKEMDDFLNNQMEIMANNEHVAPGGEVPFMILFYNPPENVANYGVKFVDAKNVEKPEQ